MHVLRLAGDAEREARLDVVALFGPDRPASPGHMEQRMFDASQRHDGAMREGNCRRQAVESRRDPCRMTFCEGARVAQGRALRHCQNRIARGETHAQGEAARGRRPTQRDDDGFAGVLECDERRSCLIGCVAQELKHDGMLAKCGPSREFENHDSRAKFFATPHRARSRSLLRRGRRRRQAPDEEAKPTDNAEGLSPLPRVCARR